MSQSRNKIITRPHICPNFYGVYLLRSIPKPGTFYIGSTPDPVRRLRQHNGDLTSGGAFKTKRRGYRPWDMIMLIHGFPNKIAALQFEHAWQHCYQTRHIDVNKRITTSKTGGRSLAHKIGNARLLLNAPFFKVMGLKIMFFDEIVYNTYVENKFRISDEYSLFIEYVKLVSNKDDGNLKDLEDFKDKYLTRNKELMEKFSKTLQYGEYSCCYCDEKIDYINSDEFPYISICYHNDCENICHLNCLYHEARSQNTFDKPLIPQKVKCQKCLRSLQWSEVAKYSTWIRGKIGLDEHELDGSQINQDIFEEDLNSIRSI